MLERIEIEAFLTLAAELHFGRTAERLHLSPGRISQTIKSLEIRIGAPLFERTSRSVRLTPVGALLQLRLAPAYDEVDRAVAAAISAAAGTRIRLHVGYTTPWCGDLMIAAGDRLVADFPEAEVTFEELSLSDPLSGLRSGRVDLQVSELPIAEPGLSTGPVLVEERRMLLVPVDHPLAARDSVLLEDLARTLLIPIQGAPAYWSAVHTPETTSSGRRIPHAPGVRQWSEALALVAAGRGVTIGAERAMSYHPHPSVAGVPFMDAEPIRYALAWRSDNHDPAVGLLIDAAVAVAAEL